jgi:hypothetical protein
MIILQAKCFYLSVKRIETNIEKSGGFRLIAFGQVKYLFNVLFLYFFEHG